MKNVIAEEHTYYTCNYPYCEELIISDCKEDWDIEYDSTVEIKCNECDNVFEVDLP